MQVVFSSNEDLDAGDQQTSLIPTVEEETREEDGQAEDAGSEQQFGVFKDFDFLDVELEDAEVRTDLYEEFSSLLKILLFNPLGINSFIIADIPVSKIFADRITHCKVCDVHWQPI